MKITINKAFAINDIGGRSNNEDSIYPLMGKADENNNLFMVCDGVGGNEKGEVASRLACDSFAQYFAQNPVEQSDEAYIDKALKYTEAAFDTYIQLHPQAKGMGTTLTLLHLHSGGATIAHVGDSRVYQYHAGKLIAQTSDHSLVNELLKDGILSEEQARNHPRKNVITRAIQGSVKPTKAEVKIVTNISAGDYFFLCSDGIIENVTDFELQQILGETISDEEKNNKIKTRCLENPNDNFSSYLIPIKHVEGAVLETQDTTALPAQKKAGNEINPDIVMGVVVEDGNTNKFKNNLFSKLLKHKLLLFIVGILLSIGIYWFTHSDNSDKPGKQQDKTENQSRKNSGNNQINRDDKDKRKKKGEEKSNLENQTKKQQENSKNNNQNIENSKRNKKDSLTTKITPEKDNVKEERKKVKKNQKKNKK